MERKMHIRIRNLWWEKAKHFAW